VRRLAALNAATFLKLQLSNESFIRLLDRARAQKTQLAPLPVKPVPNNSRDLVDAIREIGEHRLRYLVY
jgi:hypothetical protein